MTVPVFLAFGVAGTLTGTLGTPTAPTPIPDPTTPPLTVTTTGGDLAQDDAAVWTVWAQNEDATGRVARVDVFDELVGTLNHNGAGTWTLKGVPAVSTAGAALSTPGARLEITRKFPGAPSVTVQSGQVLGWDRNYKLTDAGPVDTFDFEGIDDTALIGNRVAHPEPGTLVPPYVLQDHDVRTGAASSVIWEYVNANLGPGAIPDRRLPIVMAPDLVYGSTVTGRARWQNLLEFCASLAELGGVGFRIIDLKFDVFQPSTTPRVVFSPSRGTVAGWEAKTRSAGANFAYIGGGSISGTGNGEGTDRVIYEGGVTNSIDKWGRIETFTDSSDIADDAALAQALDGVLGNLSNEVPTVNLDTIDRAGRRWGVDYDLGDLALVDLDGLEVTDVVRQVKITINQAGATVKATVGPNLPIQSVMMFRAINNLRTRVLNLERR